MNAQLSMFDLMICEDSANAISSPEAASGASPPALPDGPTTDRSGLARARASRSASREKAEAPTILGTCGPTSFASSVPAGRLSSWESRLRERLAMVGSTEFPLIWKEKATPAGRSISRLAPSMRRTSDSGSIGWPTPCVPNGGRQPKGGAMSLTGQTPDGMKRQVDLHFVARHILTEGGGNAHLPIQARESASWPTPQAGTPAQNGYNEAGGTDFTRKIDVIEGLRETVNGRRSGPTPNSGSAQTEKRGALNPEFVFWLMGCPAEWVSCALAAMQSFRKSRSKFSAR